MIWVSNVPLPAQGTPTKAAARAGGEDLQQADWGAQCPLSALLH